MELRQLKYFIKAAELSNFTAASQALYITQSTLSQQIKTLEDELNTPLFDRIAKRVRLTEAGRLFLPSAIKTVKYAESGKQLIKDLDGLLTGSLCIGLTYGLSNLLLDKLTDFAETYPLLKINITYGTSGELLDQLKEGDLDFVLSFYNTPNPLFESTVLFESHLSLIVHQDHSLATAKSVDLKQLSDLPMVLPVSQYSISEFLNTRLAKMELSLNVKMEINDIYSLLQLAATQKWCTILMNTSLFNFPQLKAIPLSGKQMVRHATITWSTGIYRKKAAVIFAELLNKL
ncbi:LysR family transcriptional regulator [Mucilaginibacter agri]|uniref:LysR family transcriptional regulator n=1 Tax=Mucilaginibacter agri TaxID=2695265 RepID=A0A966DRN4_9SPHI|nr:LysR substrate-binding domain-containing protein [Mucilaginibacter agri]NCD68665.1 LysR family transcriptional regulator [Mucilaginibacter agri]